MSKITADYRMYLCGRDAELTAVDDAVASASAGRFSALLLTGEPGSGKSVLLNYASAHAAECQMLWVAGVEAESQLAFAGLHRLFGAPESRIRQLPEPQRGALSRAIGVETGEVDPFVLGAAVLNMLVLTARDAPLLLCIDDLGLLDAATHAALGFAIRRLRAGESAGRAGHAGIAVIAVNSHCCAPHDAFAELTARPLPALDGSACAAVLKANSHQTVSCTVAEQLAANTGGNPLAFVELAGILNADQLTGRTPLPEPLPVGTGIMHAYGSAARSLSEQAQRALIIAAAETTASPALFLNAAGKAGIDNAAIEAAERSGIIAIEPMIVRFAHPLIRAAVYAGAHAAARRAAHDAIAAALEQSEEADRRAWHRAAAAIAPTEAVADELERTAHVAQARGGQAAQARALEYAAIRTPEAFERARRFVDAAECANAAGEVQRAWYLLDQADRTDRSAYCAARSDQVRAEAQLRNGVVADAYTAFISCARRLASIEPREALDALASAAEAACYAGDIGKLLKVRDRALSLPLPAEPSGQLILELLIANGELYGGEAVAGSARLHRAIVDSGALDGEITEPRRLVYLATAATLAGLDGEAHTIANLAVDAARAAGALAVLPQAFEYLVSTELFRGAYDQARQRAAEGLEIAERSGQGNSACQLRAYLALIAAFKGDEQSCRDYAASALRDAIARGLGLQAGIANWALGVIDLGLGRTGGAMRTFAGIAGAGPGVGHPAVVLLSAPHRVEALLRHDPPDVDSATKTAAMYDQWAAHSDQAWALALSARCEALLAQKDEAAAHFERALELHERSGRPFDRARTELQYGELLRRQRGRAKAQVLLRSAWETFDRLGAELWKGLARSELRAAGETVPAEQPTGDPRDNLTAQELRIARLAAAGATNKEIASQLYLSPRTVDYHLRKVFHQLGISSRVDLARMRSLTD